MIQILASIARKSVLRGIVLFLFLSTLLASADFVVGVTTDRRGVTVEPNYYRNVMAYDRVVALSFDDGPDPEKTLAIMDVLNKHQVPATFFFVGLQALKHPDIVRHVHQSGYEIGNHTLTHSKSVHESKERLKFELDTTDKIISSITDEPTLLYRPPYLLDIGSDAVMDINDHSPVLDWVLEAGYIPIGADIDSLDWHAQSSQEVVGNTIKQAADGHIILLHDSKHSGQNTVQALDQLITELKSRGYRFETVSSVIGMNASQDMKVTRNLSLGSTDKTTQGEVTRLQTFLLKEGYYLQAPTGLFNQTTQDALKEWQEEHGIMSELGMVGPQTIEIINQNLLPIKSGHENINLLDNPDYQEFTRQIQTKFIKAFSLTTNNFTLIIQLVILLIIFRLLFITFVSIASILKPYRIKEEWQGGVSVIIPVYNEEENIKATLNSILLSTHRKVEIIVVDDGSTDDSAAVVEKLVQTYPEKITLISQENAGKAAALNRGIAHSRHEVVICVDGDTIFEPETIRYLVRPFSDKEVAAVSGKVVVTNSKNIISYFQHLEYVIAQNIDKESLSHLNAVNVVPGPVGAWRKSTIVSLGGYSSDTLVEDQDLTLAVLTTGKRILYEPKAVAYTETPFRLLDFIKQRARWVMGSFQCLIKYAKYLFHPRLKNLGFVVLPNTIIYSLLLPLLYPLLDVVFILLMLTNPLNQIWWLFAIFIFIDFYYAFAAFLKESQKKNLLLWFPLQRIFYRLIIGYIVFTSLYKVIEGGHMIWKKVVKRGEASQQFINDLAYRSTN